MRKIVTQFKNYLQTTMEGVGNGLHFDPLDSLHRRQLTIFLVFFIVLTSLLTISGCARDLVAFPSKTLSNDTYQSPAQPSTGRETKAPSKDSQPDFTYRTSKSRFVSPVNLSAKPSVTESVKVNLERLVRLDHEIGAPTIAAANDLIALASASKDPIEVYIDSPGGSVYAGMVFIEAMEKVKEQGVVIKCYVPQFAASMAFTIFTQCSERYALPYAQLLFHAPRIGGMFLLTPPVAMYLASRLFELDSMLLGLITPVMGIDKKSAKWFTESYDNERLFLAQELSSESPKPWFKIVARMVSK